MGFFLSESDIEQLKVGDEVGITSGDHYNPPLIKRVTRRTRTTVLVGEQRFNKHGRSTTSSSFRAQHLMPADEARQRIAEYQQEHGLRLARRFLRDYAWGHLTIEQCNEVKALLATFNSSTDAAAAVTGTDALSIAIPLSR